MSNESAPISPINVPGPIGSLARAVNRTYSYANNSLFGALIPTYYKDYYYRNVRVACGWLDGYVPDLHGNDSGLISTRIGQALITGLTKQICGEQLIFRSTTDGREHESLKFVSNWYKEQKVRKAVYAAIGYALAVGTSLLKVNRKMNGDLWFEACRFDNCFFTTSFSNEVEEATFFIKNYVDTTAQTQFVLTEHRYYEYADQGSIELTEEGYKPKKVKGTRTAMVEYKIYQTKGTAQNNLQESDNGCRSMDWAQLPPNIRRMIKKDYAILRVGEPMKLGFPTIGVEVLLDGEQDLGIPTGANFGQGKLTIIQDDMITYEVASSYLLRDMYLGKGTVYVPKDLTINDYNPFGIAPETGVLSGIGENKIETVKGVSPDEQKIVVDQFQLRANEWQAIKENALKNIAVKWGMSPKILASFLANGMGQQTATQIDSEDDATIAFINLERSYFKDPINKLIELVLNYNGLPIDVEADFASPSLLNKDRIIDRSLKKLENGLIDIEEAIREINPDLDEEALQGKIAKAKEAREAMMMPTEFNAEGGFGNAYDDLGGANLKGSTSPVQ